MKLWRDGRGMELVIMNFFGAIPAFMAGAFVMFCYMEHTEATAPEAMHQRKRQEFFTSYMMKVNDRWDLLWLKTDAQRWSAMWKGKIDRDPQSKNQSAWESAYCDTNNIINLIGSRITELDQQRGDKA